LAHEKSPLTHLRCGLSILPAGLSEKERTAFDSLDMASKKGNRAYFVMMTARPQTVGYGVTDFPPGLTAWILVHSFVSESNISSKASSRIRSTSLSVNSGSPF
jgi:hypothetical protein